MVTFSGICVMLKRVIEWASARVPPTPLLGGWLQLERSLDSAASSALLIDRPAQKHRTEAGKWRRRFKGFKRKAFEGF